MDIYFFFETPAFTFLGKSQFNRKTNKLMTPRFESVYGETSDI